MDEGLDKASIVRLALNTLAKTTKKQTQSADILDLLDTMKKSETGMTENEIFDWWNESKKKA